MDILDTLKLAIVRADEAIAAARGVEADELAKINSGMRPLQSQLDKLTAAIAAANAVGDDLGDMPDQRQAVIDELAEASQVAHVARQDVRRTIASVVSTLQGVKDKVLIQESGLKRCADFLNSAGLSEAYKKQFE